MFLMIILSLSFIIFLYVIVHKLIKVKSRTIDGLQCIPIVKGLPVLGIFLHLKFPLCNYLKDLGIKYGNIFMIKFGMRNIIVLNDFSIIKKTIKDQGEIFSGRWMTKLKTIICDDNGILFIDGKKYMNQKSFILKVFRDFGFGKSISNTIVQEECKYLMDELKGLVGKSVDFSELIPIYTANIISKFIMNKRFSRNDSKVKCIENTIFQITKKRNIVELVHLLFPFFDQCYLLSKVSLWLSSRIKLYKDITEIFDQEIKEHYESLDFNSQGNDLIDRFLIQQNQLTVKEGNPKEFTNRQLIFLTFELFGAGYETTSTSLGWSLFFMANYQAVQYKVHQEIISKIGKDRTPSMNDKILLTYTQAVIDEIFRLSSVVPLGIFHRTLCSTKIDNFYVPSDTLIFTNLYACHRDKKIWEKPYEFYPEHFLSRTDDNELKYIHREELIPFGIGKRQCLGESLARMEFFIFFVSIFQVFQVSFSKPLEVKEYESVLQGNDGMIRFCNAKNFVFKTYKN